ncbi:MAG: efflux RND transporter periplasmic adaptor subunit [Alphaproteobacteria bacterium]|nr:efflux RND transporter periplasmic adaptor subunit [Alphaproteobacteria bacterium]
MMPNINYSSKVYLGILVTIALLLLLGGCKKEEQVEDIRPVRTVVIERHDVGDPIILTGQLRARDEVSLGFRLSGKLIERPVNIGDFVKAGQTVAVLDSETEKNAKNAAQADYVAAQAVLEQASAAERRSKDLLRENAVSKAEYEAALRQLKTAQAQVDAAKAKLDSAKDQLGYTELKADADGVITAKGAEPGEVVRAGQMILLLARQDGRDAVFDMPAQVIRNGLSTQQDVDVWLADNSDIKTSGQIREVSPQADPATRTYQVKVGLKDVPSSMFLGSTIVGRLTLQAATQIQIPATALAMSQGKPAVWIVDEKGQTVHIRSVEVVQYTQDSVVIAEGLKTGERVVTAGVQALHEDQKVKLLEVTK